METYIRQRQLIMSPLITSHVIGENEPLTSVLNKVIAAKEVNHKGQGTELGGPLVGPEGGGQSWCLDSSLVVIFLWYKTDLLGTAHLKV